MLPERSSATSTTASKSAFRRGDRAFRAGQKLAELLPFEGVNKAGESSDAGAAVGDDVSEANVQDEVEGGKKGGTGEDVLLRKDE